MWAAALVALLAGRLGGPDAPSETIREPVPSPDARREAEKTVQGLFKEDTAKARRPEERRALARKLIEHAVETRDDPAARFVLLREALSLAAASGDLELTLKAVEELSARYLVDPLDEKLRALSAMSPAGLEPRPIRKIAVALLELSETGIAADRYDVAVKAAEGAAGPAKASRDPSLLELARAAVRRAQDLEREYDKVKPAIEKLKADFQDGDASLALGSYLALEKGAWAQGLAYLVRAKDEKLRSLSARDLASPKAPKEQVDLGEGWADLARKEKGKAKERMLGRALNWYQAAAAGLSGLEKVKVEKKLEGVISDPALGGGSRIDWEALKKEASYRYERESFGKGDFDYSDKKCVKLFDGQAGERWSAGSVGWARVAPPPITIDLRKKCFIQKVRIWVHGPAPSAGLGSPDFLAVWAGSARARGTLLARLEPIPESTGWLEVPILPSPAAATRHLWIDISESRLPFVIIDEVELR